MYGEKGKIGLIVPSVNTVVEPEFNKMAPEGISIYSTRVLNDTGSKEDLSRMNENLERASIELKSAKVDIIVYACTAGSFINGIEGERKTRNMINNISGIQTITTSMAVINSLNYYKAKNVALLTPYSQDVHLLAIKFFKENGFEILRDKRIGTGDAYSSGNLTFTEILQNAKKIFTNKAEILFLSCTNLPTIYIIQQLEEEFKIPVISSNLATFWQCLRILEYKKEIKCFGQLLRHGLN